MTTFQKIDQVLSYNSENGELRWKVYVASNAKKGGLAGCIHKQGYRVIFYSGKSYSAHRLAWLLYYGDWPSYEIDHINSNRADNRISNLRDIPHVANMQNLKKGRGDGLPYTAKTKSGKWSSVIKINGKAKYLGLFSNSQEAHDAAISHKN